MKKVFTLCLAIILTFCATAQTARPYTKAEVIEAVTHINSSGVSRSPFTDEVIKRRVDFKVTNEVMAELKAAGAWPGIISTVMAYGPKDNPSNPTPSNNNKSSAKIPLGKYTCYAVGASIGQLDYTGYFTLNSDGTYQYMNNRSGTGRYLLDKQTIRFLTGPYADVTGNLYTNNDGTQGLQITFHDGKANGLKQNCGCDPGKKK